MACDHDGELQDGCLGGTGTRLFDYLLGKTPNHTAVRGLVSKAQWPWAQDMGPGDDCSSAKDCAVACTKQQDPARSLVGRCDDGVCVCEPQCPAVKEAPPYAARIDGWLWLSRTPAGEANMTAWVARFGPLAVAIDAGGLTGYEPGTVIRPNKTLCDPATVIQHIDHEVLVTGYGVQDGVDYWLVKNSWGDRFGERGYFRLERGVNACGIAMAVSTSYKNATLPM